MNPDASHAAYGYAGMVPYQGRAKPSQIVSHRIPIDEAPDAYAKFDKRIEGYTKILIKFEKQAA